MPATKRPPAKYQPKGLTVLHEDKDVIVVKKPCGLLTMGTVRDKARTVHTIIYDGASRPVGLFHPPGQRQTADL